MRLGPYAFAFSIAAVAAGAASLPACAARAPAPRAVARPAVEAARAPDFNGDRHADLVIGAPGAQPEEIGRVFMHLGGPSGWRPAPSQVLAGPDAVGAEYGAALAVGDFDGDGHADLAVGAPGDAELAGRVYLYRGGPRGLQTEPSAVLAGEAGTGARFGAALAAAGDVDGDGFADLVVGAPAAAGGRAYLHPGGASGVVARASATYYGDAAASTRFGEAVAGAGDVNGDRHGEVLVGAPAGASLAGLAALFAGAADRLSPVPVLTIAGITGAPDALGTRVAGVGDLNGDGFADVVLAAPLADGGRGTLHVHRGARAGLAAIAGTVITNPDGPDGDGAGLGVALAAAGDVDGDGLDDFVAGENGYRAFTGRLHYYRGTRGVQPRTPTRSWTGPAGTYAGFGSAVAGGGDADGDGYPEIVVSAPGARRVYVYAGGPSGPSAEPVLVVPSPPGSPGGFGAALATTGRPQ